MESQQKILVIDGDQEFIDSLKKSHDLQKFNVCYASDCKAGILKAMDFHPDLILCEINQDETNGYQDYSVFCESFLLKRIPFIFLKQNATMEDVRQGMNLGADDFFSKPTNIPELVGSIEIRLQKYKKNGHETAWEPIKKRMSIPNEPSNTFFTKRENQVLELSMEGMPIKIIADQLSISTRTVEKYRTKLMEKTGANNIVEVIVFALKNGLVKI